MLEPIFIGQAAIGPGENRVVQMPLGRFPSGALVEVPIHVSRSQFSGPTVLLMAGLHGDEINGVEILRRVLESGINVPNIGSTITIPLLNAFGFIHYPRRRSKQRCKPLLSRQCQRQHGLAHGSLNQPQHFAPNRCRH